MCLLYVVYWFCACMQYNYFVNKIIFERRNNNKNNDKVNN